MVLYTPSIPGKYLYEEEHHILAVGHSSCSVPRYLRMVEEIVWIIVGIFAVAIVISLVLAHIHGTFA